MHLLSLLHLSIFLAMLLSACTSLLASKDSNPTITKPPPRSLQHPPRGLNRNTPGKGDRFTMGPFKVFILNSIAIMPVIPPRKKSKTSLRHRIWRHQGIFEHTASGAERGGAAIELGSCYVDRVAAFADDGTGMDEPFRSVVRRS